MQKFGGYDPQYSAPHMNAKGTFNDYLRAQASDPSGKAFSWTILTTGPYIENLAGVRSFCSIPRFPFSMFCSEC